MVKTGIILAGGFGRRMRAITGGSHKSLLLLPDKKTVLGRMIWQMSQAGIRKILIVHFTPIPEDLKKEIEIYSFLYKYKLNIQLVSQDPIKEYGTMFALKVACVSARGEFDCLVVEGDVICKNKIIATLASERGSIFLLENKITADPEAMKCRINGSKIEMISKSLKLGYEFCALMRLSFPDRKKFSKACDLVRLTNPYFEDAFSVLIQGGEEFRYRMIPAEEWIEIDTPQDYARAKRRMLKWTKEDQICQRRYL